MTKIFVPIIVILLITSSGFAQVTYPVKFVKQDSTFSIVESCILKTENGDLLLFWLEFVDSWYKILYSRSTDRGLTWNDKSILIGQISISSGVEMDAVVLNDGKILFTYKSGVHYLISSTDNGLSWSEASALPTRNNNLQRSNCNNLKLNVLSDGTISVVYNYRSDGIFTIRSNDGITWSQFTQIDNKGIAGSIVSLDTNNDLFVYTDSLSNYWNLVYRTSSNAGITWSEKQVLHPALFNDSNPRIVKGTNDKLWIYFEREDITAFPQLTQSEIYFITSTNNGLNWTNPERFTNYRGNDFNLSFTLMNNIPMVCFLSERTFQGLDRKTQIFYGTKPDINTPPVIFDIFHLPQEPVENQPITIRAYVDDDTTIQSVKAVLTKNFENPVVMALKDDGQNNDSLPNDRIYGGLLSLKVKPGDLVKYYCVAEDVSGNIAWSVEKFFSIPIDFNVKRYLFENNRYKMPISYDGVFADVLINGQRNGRYDDNTILFSGGFLLSGYDNDFLWANLVYSASRAQDYLPGPVGSVPEDPKNNIYIVKASDPPFSQSWQDYRYAAMIGAPFYDGDFDGIYNPIDKNGNGIWDEDEDAPEILGDITAWCVFNDGVDPALRRLNDVYPLGIEIQQTVFSFNLNENNLPDEKIYVRYRIINRGTINEILDSVIFTFWLDPDIGDYMNDLVGCDTLINLGYAYSNIDPAFGVNPPATGLALIQGPPVYKPGETYIDNDLNGIFDPDIDTPTDTAVFKNGSNIPAVLFPGAKNQSITSFYSHVQGQPHPDPLSKNLLRNWQNSRYHNELTNPCTYTFGVVLGPYDCSEINPLFLFSGDPGLRDGWLFNITTDVRFLLSTGQFTLLKDTPIDIWGVYAAGRGEDSLQSINELRKNTQSAHNFYKQLPVNEPRTPPVLPPDEFILYQNYPNPFNPGTIIRYELPINSLVSIKIFDILGREVKTLVNEFKSAGRYEVEFDGSNYASGVYFYQLKALHTGRQAGDYTRTLKMALIK